MIRYGLVCAAGHCFDGWFRSSDDFEAQAKRHLLSCAVCGSEEVTKALMAPAVVTGAAEAAAPAPAAPPPSQEVALVSDEHRRLRRMLTELRAELVKDAVDVGDRFPEEARKIHYGEAEPASIYGRASTDEARRLAEEGIRFQPLPGLPDEHN